MIFYVNYALLNLRSPYQDTVDTDILSISIKIYKQNKYRDLQGKGYSESALSCIKESALCNTDMWRLYIFYFISNSIKYFNKTDSLVTLN